MKKAFLIFFFCLLFTPHSFLSADITTGLVGYWKFDEGSGTTAADSSGNGNTGTLTNGPTWVAGKINGGINFDGVNDKVSTGNTTFSSNSYTVSAWINPQSTTAGTIFAYKNSDGTNRFILQLSNGFLRLYHDTTGGFLGSIAIQPNVWTFVTATYDGTTRKLYANAQSAGSAASVYNPSTNNGPYEIGNHGGSVFNGNLDDVRIYNRVLSASDITELYNFTEAISPSPAPAPTPTPPPPSPSPSPTPTPAPSPTPTPPPTSTGRVDLLNSSGAIINTYSTIQACANVVSAGQTCSIYSDIYDERVSVTRSGLSGSPIIFKSANSTKAKVRAFALTNANYVTVDNLEVTNIGMPTVDQEYHGNVLISGGTGIRITNNYIHDTNFSCIGFGNTTFLTISGNIMDYCGVARSIVGNPGGPYVITAGVNDQIKLSLNGSINYTITLTPGTRTSSQICSDINSVAGDSAVASLNAVDCEGLGADGRIQISPYWKGPANSVTLQSVSNNAYATLGLSLGSEVDIGAVSAVTVTTTGLSNDILIENNQISRVSDFVLPGGQRYVVRNNIFGPSDIANTIHIDGIQSNNTVSYLLMEGNKFIDDHTSDNHFLLTSANSNNWIVRFNSTLRSKGGVAWGCSLCGNNTGLAFYNNVFYNNTDYYTGWDQVGFTTAISNLARNNIWYRSVRNPGGNPYSIGTGSSLDKDYDLLYQSGNASESHQVNADPLFTNASNGDFSLQSSSPARDAGGSLTTTTNSGSNSTTLVVTASYPFQSGWAGVQADWVAIGGVTNVAQISSIDYSTNIITLSSPLSWSIGVPVYLYKNSSNARVYYGTAPDIGIYEYPAADPTPTPSPSPTPTPIAGDLNYDHIVNSLDFSIMNSQWLTSNSQSDLNSDGSVNSLDYAILSSNWGKTW